MYNITKRNKEFNPWLEPVSLEKVFDEFFRSAGALTERSLFTPKISLSEDEKVYKVVAELPGVSKDELKVEMDEGLLSITAERKKSERKKDENLHIDEMEYGFFSRKMAFPSKVDPNGIKAEFKDGLLTVTVPKVEKSSAVQIKVD